MNAQDLSNALLLRDSGELPPDQVAELEAYLLEHPEAAALAEEVQVLQEAGRFASQQTVPPLNELDLERITAEATRNPTRWVPAVLAAAATVAILLFGLPFLTSPTPSLQEPQWVELDTPPTETVPVIAEAEDLPDTGDLWQDLADLEAEMAAWQSLSLKDDWLVQDEATWAAEILATGDSI